MHREIRCSSLPGLQSRLKYLLKKHVLRVASPPVLFVENGPAMFKRILPKHAFYSHPMSQAGPSWSRREEYYREMDDIGAYLRDRPLVFTLYHSGGMGEALRNKTRAQLLSGQSLLSQLFRLALQEPESPSSG